MHLYQQDIYVLILDYLKQQGLFETVLEFTKETQCDELWLPGSNPELSFLRELIFEGKWDETIEYLRAFEQMIDEASMLSGETWTKARLCLKKQQYLELITVQGQVQEEAVRDVLEEIKGLASGTDFHELCYLLTLDEIQVHPSYSNWSSAKGRIACLESLIPILSLVLPSTTSKHSSRYKDLPKEHLITLLEQAMSYQVYEHQRHDSSYVCPSNMIANLCSERFDTNGVKLEKVITQEASSRLVEFAPDITKSLSIPKAFDRSASSALPLPPATFKRSERVIPIPGPPESVKATGDRSSVSRSYQFSSGSLSAYLTSQNVKEANKEAIKEQRTALETTDTDRLIPSPIKNTATPKEKPSGVVKRRILRKPQMLPTPKLKEVIEPLQEYSTKDEKNEIGPVVDEPVERIDKNPSNLGTTSEIMDKKAEMPDVFSDSKPETTSPMPLEVNLTLAPEIGLPFSQSTSTGLRPPAVGIQPTGTEAVYQKAQSSILDLMDSRELNKEVQRVQESLPSFGDNQMDKDQASQNLTKEAPVNNATSSPDVSNTEDVRGLVSSPKSSIEAEDFVDISHFSVIAESCETHAIRAAAFDSRGERLAIGTNGKTLKLYDMKSVLSLEGGSSSLPALPLLHEWPNHHNGSVYCVAWNWDNALIATGSNDKTVKVTTVNPSSSDLVTQRTFKSHQGLIRSVCFAVEESTTQSLLCSAGAGDNVIRIWDIQSSDSNDPLMALDGHAGAINTMVLSRNNLVTGAMDQTIRLWDFRTGCCERVITKCSSPVQALSFHPTEEYTIASGHVDGSCHVWDLRSSRELIDPISYHQNECRSIGFSSCGKYLLTGSFDQRICLLKAQNQAYAPIACFHQHQNRILQVKWHPTHPSHFISTGADKRVKLWRSIS